MKPSTKTAYPGKVQYRAVQPEVERKIAEGYPVKHIYRALAEAGRLSMSYNNFLFYVRGQGERKYGLKAAQRRNRPLKTEARPAPRPVDRDKNRTPFSHEKVANLDDLGPPPKNVD